MAFTYSSNALDEPLNHLRLLVQDTIEAGHFFEDEEIVFIASKSANIHRAAASLCRTIAARLAKTPSQKDSTVTFDSEARIREMRLLADEYDREAARSENALEASNAQSGSSAEISLMAGSVPSAFTRDLHYSD